METERRQITVSVHTITFLYTTYLRSSLSRIQDHIYATIVLENIILSVSLVNLLMNPLIPKDSISVYTSNLLYVSTSAGARAMFDFDCANLITCVTILWIKLILECTVKESKIDIDRGVVGPFASAALLANGGSGGC